jgi:hypothetical protein
MNDRQFPRVIAFDPDAQFKPNWIIRRLPHEGGTFLVIWH